MIWPVTFRFWFVTCEGWMKLDIPCHWHIPKRLQLLWRVPWPFELFLLDNVTTRTWPRFSLLARNASSCLQFADVRAGETNADRACHRVIEHRAANVKTWSPQSLAHGSTVARVWSPRRWSSKTWRLLKLGLASQKCRQAIAEKGCAATGLRHFYLGSSRMTWLAMRGPVMVSQGHGGSCWKSATETQVSDEVSIKLTFLKMTQAHPVQISRATTRMIWYDFNGWRGWNVHEYWLTRIVFPRVSHFHAVACHML